jgi:hypothetical protein
MRYRDISDISRKAVFAGIGVGLASMLAACGQSANQGPSSSPTSSAITQASNQASASQATGTSDDTLTGFGATLSVWNAHHTADTKFDANSAYDPDPALPSYLGQDVYVSVQWQDGRATDYQMNVSGLSAHRAIARVLRELPPDGRVLWGANRGACYQVELTSPALGRALTGPGINDPQGQVLVEFQTMLPDGSVVYRGTDVNGIVVSLGYYPTAASAPGC